MAENHLTALGFGPTDLASTILEALP
jgi:hypothetical protein